MGRHYLEILAMLLFLSLVVSIDLQSTYENKKGWKYSGKTKIERFMSLLNKAKIRCSRNEKCIGVQKLFITGVFRGFVSNQGVATYIKSGVMGKFSVEWKKLDGITLGMVNTPKTIYHQRLSVAKSYCYKQGKKCSGVDVAYGVIEGGKFVNRHNNGYMAYLKKEQTKPDNGEDGEFFLNKR